MRKEKREKKNRREGERGKSRRRKRIEKREKRMKGETIGQKKTLNLHAHHERMCTYFAML